MIFALSLLNIKRHSKYPVQNITFFCTKECNVLYKRIQSFVQDVFYTSLCILKN